MLVISYSHYFYKIETKAFAYLDESRVAGSLHCLGLRFCVYITLTLKMISESMQCSREEEIVNVMLCFFLYHTFFLNISHVSVCFLMFPISFRLYLDYLHVQWSVFPAG